MSFKCVSQEKALALIHNKNTIVINFTYDTLLNTVHNLLTPPNPLLNNQTKPMWALVSSSVALVDFMGQMSKG